jgi:hypothetical protein
MGVGGSRISKYYVCSICLTGYFGRRYLPKEMKNIYGQYREEAYLSIRKKWEPWYSESYNENHNSKDWIASRVNALTEFLLKSIKDEIHSVVDVGGDQGQFIPPFATLKIVQEISDRELLPGVMRISNLSEIESADLIIYAHVLEHVAEPINEVRVLLEKANYVYLEVPFGIPEINKERKNKLRFAQHFLSSFSAFCWKSRTMPSSGRIVPSNKMLSQSEHLTFFNEKSIEFMAELLGVSVIIEKGSISTPDSRNAVVLQCLLIGNRIDTR